MIGPPSSVIIDRVLNGNLRPLIINLYTTDRGYSVVFPGTEDGRNWTSRCFSYEDENELLIEVENERLPVFLVDLIDQYCCAPLGSDQQSTIFYEGCICVEIRDFRRRPSNTSTELSSTDASKYETTHTVLRPTPTTLLNDLESLKFILLCTEKHKKKEIGVGATASSTESAESIFGRQARSEQQRMAIETDFWRLVGSNAHNPPKVDERSTSGQRRIGWTSTKHLRYDTIARRRRERTLCLEQHFPIMNWVINNTVPGQRRAAAIRSSQSAVAALRAAPTTPSTASGWKMMIPTALKSPIEIADKRLQRAKQQQEENQSESVDGMELIEEYGIEMVNSSNKQKTRTRIRIYRRYLDCVYVGNLRIEREEDAANNTSNNTSSSGNNTSDGGSDQQSEKELSVSECSFLLGTEGSSRLYVKQYLEMVSEGGRRHLTLTRRLPGKPAQLVPQGSRATDFNIIPLNAPTTPVVIPVQAVASSTNPIAAHIQGVVASSNAQPPSSIQYQLSRRPSRSQSGDNSEQHTQSTNIYFNVN